MACMASTVRALLLLGLLASSASERHALQLSPGPAASRAHVTSAGAEVESLFTSADLQALLGGPFVYVRQLGALADGDLVLSVGVGFAGAALVHWDCASGRLTRIASEVELGLAMGGYQGGSLDVHGFDVAPNGDLWLFASEFLGVFGGLSTTAHLLRVRLVGEAPAGYLFPTSVLSLPFDPEGHALNLRAAPDGAIDLLLDTGDVASDALPLAPGHGIYRWFPDLSVIPLAVESYVDLAAACSRGGPQLSGDGLAQDTGLGNLAAGANALYVCHSRTAETLAPHFDATNAEAYDGDILRFDRQMGTSSRLIARKEYLARTNALAGEDPLAQDRDVLGISLVVDEQTDRLYTLEYTFAGPAPSHEVVQLLAWQASTGAFEGVVANAWDLLSPWLQLDQQPVFQSGQLVIGATLTEGNLCALPDGRLAAAIRPGTSAELPTHVVRITPALP